MLKDLADTFLQDPAMEFPQGRLVAGRVLTEVRPGIVPLAASGPRTNEHHLGL